MGEANPCAKSVLLVEPDYYSRYPPLGLLKLSSYYKSIGAFVRYVRGIEDVFDIMPDTIEITSLFTYSRKHVFKVIEHYHNEFPNAIMNIGGIYASLLPHDLEKRYPYLKIQIGLNRHADGLIPDYSILRQVEKWNSWDGSILFTSRGCINRCKFCMVPKLEGSLKNVTDVPSELVMPEHSRVIVWDNNFLAQPGWYEKLIDLKKTNKWIDFNQGLDARLLTEECAEILSSMKIKEFRFAYDGDYQKKAAHDAVDLLSSFGINTRRISFYTLYNFHSEDGKQFDTPDGFYNTVLDILEMCAVSYPMRYVPLNADGKNSYISPYWTFDELEMVAKARRVIGYGGAFPPYAGLVKKFRNACNFEEAFGLDPIVNG